MSECNQVLVTKCVKKQSKKKVQYSNHNFSPGDINAFSMCRLCC